MFDRNRGITPLIGPPGLFPTSCPATSLLLSWTTGFRATAMQSYNDGDEKLFHMIRRAVLLQIDILSVSAV